MRLGPHRPIMASGVRQILLNPKIKAMQYPYREKDCPGEQESPSGSGETGEYVSQPRPYAKQSNDVCHISPLERNVVVHVIKPRWIRLGLFLSGLCALRTARLAFPFRGQHVHFFANNFGRVPIDAVFRVFFRLEFALNVDF